jgi:hypothetical protein
VDVVDELLPVAGRRTAEDIIERGSSDVRGRVMRWLAPALGVVALLVPCGSPASASRIRVDHRIFGLHDASLDSLVSSGVGALRLWDTGVTWRDIATYDPATGAATYDWRRLDGIVSAAGAGHVELTLVLGQTPSYFSADPAVVPMRETPTGASNPAVVAYRDYVAAAMQRYGSRIAAYQVWNEANVVNFWAGSAHQLARLTRIVHDARDRYAPGSLVVTAPLLTRRPDQRHWLSRFAATRVGGRPVWRYVDAFALNLYPMATYGTRPGVPEDSITLLARSRARLARAHWPTGMPIWATEVNYGLQGTPQTGPAAAKPISDARQVAYVIRTWVLDAAHRIKRVFWYSWDMAGMPGGGARGNTLLTSPSDHTEVTAAGAAFERVQTWLDGTMVGHGRHSPCVTDRHGTYTCTVRYDGSTGRIYWNQGRTATVRVVRSAHTLEDQSGRTTRVRGGATIAVDYRPVLVRSRS